MQAIDHPAELAVRLFSRMGQINAGLTALIGPEVEHGSGLSAKAHELLALLSCPTGERLQLSQLAASMLMSPSGLSRLTDRLEHDGLVERVSCRTDHRGMNLELTGAGRLALKRANRIRASALIELLPDLSSAELREIIEGLERIGQALKPGLAAAG